MHTSRDFIGSVLVILDAKNYFRVCLRNEGDPGNFFDLENLQPKKLEKWWEESFENVIQDLQDPTTEAELTTAEENVEDVNTSG